MQTCEKCKVSVRGNRKRCPLCQGALIGIGEPEDEVFPRIPDRSGSYHLVMRILVFISFTSVVVCVAIAFLLPSSHRWPYYVAGAVACMWLCMANVLMRRHNIPKNILWMVFLLSLLSVLWDYFTGWHNWAFDFVIPCLCVFAMAAVAVIAKILDMRIEEYMIYLILDALLGIVPALFLALRWVNVLYPSVICVAFSLISLAALFAFQGEKLQSEIRKRLHL